MKAVYITSFGTPGNLELREVSDPAPPSGSQILVRVRAAGLNRADLLQARGLYPPPPGYSPNVPGLEFAGEIAALGSEVSGLAVGDRVFGITAGEAQAEFLLTDKSIAVPIPESLNYMQAAAVPEAFITAHDAIFTLGQLKAGETLLIHAVGSGVGLAGLQLAKAVGARVIGTSRTATKLDKCSPFRLDEAILAAEPNFADTVNAATGGKGADVILDLVGGTYFSENLASIAPNGRLVVVGLTAGRSTTIDLGMLLQKRARVIGTVLRPRALEEKAVATQKFAADVVPLLADGRVRPNIDRVFAAADVAAAHQYLASNESFGKVVLEF